MGGNVRLFGFIWISFNSPYRWTTPCELHNLCLWVAKGSNFPVQTHHIWWKAWQTGYITNTFEYFSKLSKTSDVSEVSVFQIWVERRGSQNRIHRLPPTDKNTAHSWGKKEHGKRRSKSDWQWGSYFRAWVNKTHCGTTVARSKTQRMTCWDLLFDKQVV